MKLTKKEELEILQVYTIWLDSYLNGDVATYDKYLDKDYHFIGSTNNEEFLSKKDTTNFFKATADQLAGKTQLRNETKIIEKFEELVFITHLFDAWFLNGTDWNYYGRFRFSNALKKNKEGWRFIYQHFSTTDSKAQEGETIGFNKISAENLQLREAIKRRTIELEHKTKELEIEAALERVRAVAMSMSQPDDMLKVCHIISDQLQLMNVQNIRNVQTVIINEQKGTFLNYQYFTAYGKTVSEGAEYDKHPKVLEMVQELKKSADGIFKESFEGEALNNYREYRKKDNQFPDPLLDEALSAHFCFYSIGNGGLGLSTYKSLPETDLDIFKRFHKVFKLAYRRYMDVTQAEAQTREAQIEAALEKVRSRSMAMQHSEELLDVASILFQQVKALGVSQWNCGFNIWNIGDKEFTYYPGTPDGIIIPSLCKIPLTEHTVFMRFDESRKRGDELLVYEKQGEEQADHYRYMLSLPGVGDLLKSMLDAGYEFPTFQIDHIANFAYGNLIFITYEHFPEMHDVFKRFAKVFEQTYTRFLDLQKAEAQAREAQIEAALERVRSRSMAMHKSEELLDVISVVSEQLQQLDFKFIHVSFANNDISQDYKFWTSSKGISKPMRFNTPYLDIAMFNNLREAQEKSISFCTDILSKKEHNQWHKHLLKHGGSHVFSKEENEFIMSRGMARSIAINPNIILILANYASIPYSQEQNKIIIRFGHVFEQSYTRFLDLQKAEAQAREAQIEASLERVRSRTMAMQKSDELPEAANNLFLQVQALGIPAWSAGYCIWEGDQKSASCNMSSEGEIQKSFSLPTIGEGYNFYKPFKNEEPFYVAELGGKKLVKHYDFMKKLPIVGEILEGFDKKSISLPTFQIWHIVYFTQGYLMFITYEKVPEAHEIFKRFAKVFEQTYTRFSDLKIAEQHAIQAETDLIKLHAEKKRAEEALKELKDTQAQLIQSEKMASLGELTAGIAHEIQNPLNFVNNFSEVSNELIDEMNEEIENGDLEEAKAIAKDIKQNLEKINHHGKRADAIVKGMLQHSRSTSDKKELTDINKLTDEYLRLAYHGLRAKDKSFNATMHTDFDNAIGTINVFPQDIGRVILNLITNAFYAVTDKKKTLRQSCLPDRQAQGDSYKPTVSVSTKKVKGAIEISVSDNGNGIPTKVLDKIFQPFFTTKPTGEGTGLGLSMSYDIVKTHNGELSVNTKEGEGSTFSIHLPI